MSETVKVGSIVTWRSGHENRPNGSQPLGIQNCTVLEFGEDDAGKPAASIRLPPPFDQTVGAYVADLFIENEPR